jgi:hypothetical protein
MRVFRSLLVRTEHLARSDCDFPEMSSSHEAPPYPLADLILLVERRGVDGAAACAPTLLAHLLRLAHEAKRELRADEAAHERSAASQLLRFRFRSDQGENS